jgi:iron complex outermembrane receptor protein
LTAGYYKVSVSALNYNSDSIKVFINGKTVQNFTLHENSLSEVVVKGLRLQDLHTVSKVELQGLALEQTRGASLGDALKELAGLNSIQTGPSLSKPVIHGLYSNRVLLINDGVRQEGQQWGSEHAPEIDPFLANRITVIKGAASVRYGSDAIGGVVLLNPDDLPVQKGITGDVYLIGASNGQMGAFSGLLQGAFDKKLKGLSWRIQGTLKEAGNFKTPNYYLINTGIKEGDFSANMCYKWKRFDFDVFYSQYNFEVGIFTGSESGSLKDLLEKFNESRPAVPSNFSYKIDRSYQTVYHDLIKGRISYDLHEKGKLELTAARQNDIRNEYDSDLPYTKNPTAQLNSPQLSFQLITHTVDVIYTSQTKNGFSVSMGITGATSGNIEEGIRSLLPNFRDYNTGAFAIERYAIKKFTFEAGIRYDYRLLSVYERNQTTLAIYNINYQYSNASGTVGGTYHYNDQLFANLNVGTAWRAPSINEMYINGVHFSDASYEIGDSALKSERSLNTGLSLNYTGNKFRATIDGYYNSISNYIFEMPVFPPHQPPSGTYPTFQFTQANATIKGIDGQVQYDFLPQFTFQSKTTIVRGYNQLIHNWLVWMPSDRFENGIEYHLPNAGKLQQPYLSFENVTVLKQTRVPPNGDYVAAPAGYSLFNANAGFILPVGKNTLNVSFTVNNITNAAYRDYLDHFRYYADQLGVNYILRLKYSF